MPKKLVIDKYKYLTTKGLKPNSRVKVVIGSDLHVGKNAKSKSGKESLRLTEKYFEDTNNIDVILIPGDLVNGARSYLNEEYLRNLRYFLQMCSQKAPVIISKGNHDLFLTNPEIEKRFKNLEKIDGVYPLDNEQITVNDIVYTGFSPRTSAYSIMNHGKKANEMFMEDYRNAGFEFVTGKLNILLNHAPHLISNDLALKELNDDFKNITMIASGHLHNGYITTEFERKHKRKLSDKGFWESPVTGFAIDMCRGAYIIGDGKKSKVYLPNQEYHRLIDGTLKDAENKALLVVSKGISKYPFSPISGDPNLTEVVLSSYCYVDDDKRKKDDYCKRK